MNDIPSIWFKSVIEKNLKSPFWSQLIRDLPPAPPPTRRQRFRYWRTRKREQLALRIAPWLNPDDRW